MDVDDDDGMDTNAEVRNCLLMAVFHDRTTDCEIIMEKSKKSVDGWFVLFIVWVKDLWQLGGRCGFHG